MKLIRRLSWLAGLLGLVLAGSVVPLHAQGPRGVAGAQAAVAVDEARLSCIVVYDYSMISVYDR